MLLFSRVLTLTGSPRRVMPFAAEVTGYVNSHSSLQLSCWAASFGYPLGTVAWSAIVESQAALVGETSKLLGDDGYLDMVEKAADLVSAPGQDTLREIVYGAPGDPPPIGAVSQVTTAIAATDRMADALGWAVEIAQHVEGVIGAPVAVLTELFGQLGGITWIAVQPDIAAADSSRGKLAADSSYLGKLVATKDVFLPGSGQVGQLTRIA